MFNQFKSKDCNNRKGKPLCHNKDVNPLEDITLINIYAYNVSTQKYIKEPLTDMKRKKESITIIKGHFSTPLSTINRSSRQKINK